METPETRYQTTAQAYADGVRRLFSTSQDSLTAFGLEDLHGTEDIRTQASQLVPVSLGLTSAAVERLEDQDAQVRAEAAAQLMAKALVDFQISAFLLQAAVEEEQGAVDIPEHALAEPMTLEPPLELILGQEALSFGIRQARFLTPTDLPEAREQLLQRIGDVLEQIEGRSGRTAQLAISGLLALGVGQVAKAAGIVGMNIAQSLGAAEKVSQLYTLFRQFFQNAYNSLAALLGPTLTQSAASQVTALVNDILQGQKFTLLLNKMYETGETQQELHWFVEHSPAGLEEMTEAIIRLDELNQQHQKQVALAERMVQVLRFVPAVPAAALPQGQLLLGATYIVLTGYVIFSGADYVDAPSFYRIDRILGPRWILRSTLGEPAMESSPPEEAAEPDSASGANETDVSEEKTPWDDLPEAVGSEPPDEESVPGEVGRMNPDVSPPGVNIPKAPPVLTPIETPRSVAEPAAREEPANDRALIEEMVRLDLAVPNTPVVVDETFEIAVAIRQPTSTTLAVDGLGSVHSADGTVYREASNDLVRYKVKVSAPDCTVETSEYIFLLRAGQDSPPRFFQLTPRRPGALSIIVTAFQENDLMVAQSRVRIQATVQAVNAAPASPDAARADLLQEIERARSEAGPDNALRLALYRALCGPAFTLDDLEELCFILDLDWDLLEGETKDRKARALIRYLSSRDDMNRLHQAVKDARPNLDLS